MLFWWEEEIQRWRVLETEGVSLERMSMGSLEGGNEARSADSHARLAELELLKQVLPSRRQPDGSIKLGDGDAESGQAERQPPSYMP